MDNVLTVKPMEQEQLKQKMRFTWKASADMISIYNTERFSGDNMKNNSKAIVQ